MYHCNAKRASIITISQTVVPVAFKVIASSSSATHNTRRDYIFLSAVAAAAVAPVPFWTTAAHHRSYYCVSIGDWAGGGGAGGVSAVMAKHSQKLQHIVVYIYRRHRFCLCDKQYNRSSRHKRVDYISGGPEGAEEPQCPHWRPFNTEIASCLIAQAQPNRSIQRCWNTGRIPNGLGRANNRTRHTRKTTLLWWRLATWVLCILS